MRDYKVEFENRINFIKSVLSESGAKGIVYGNSGGKDSALVGILCKAACDNTVGIILPCTSKRNYDEDTADCNTAGKTVYGGNSAIIEPFGKTLALAGENEEI